MGIIAETDKFRVMKEALRGRMEGLRITLRLEENGGEFGAITYVIFQMGGT
jgi:hypothetical protein